MPVTSKDDGQRLIYTGYEPSELAALGKLSDLWWQAPDGWRLHVASLRCPTDRGRRISLYLEVVSPEWVSARREKRAEKQRQPSP